MNVLNENNIPKITDSVRDEDIFALQREIAVENALIEDTFTSNRTGFVTISYLVTDLNRRRHMRVVTLIIGNNTRIRDQFGNRIGFRDLRPGMVVNTSFSADMTRSIPPQARAFSIEVVKESLQSVVERGLVISVDMSRDFGTIGSILTGIPNVPRRQMRYVISDTTKLRDRRGNPITLRAIRPGHIVRIEREPFQTLSIPPQTTALTVQIISGF